MADDEYPTIDLSAELKDLPDPAGPYNLSDVPGLKRLGPLTITGTFATTLLRCPLCRQPFSIDSGIPWPHVATIPADDIDMSVPVCQDCGVKLAG